MDDLLLLSIFVAVEGAQAFSAFMPSAFTIGTFVRDEADLRKLRAGYLPALIFLLGLGSIVTVAKRSPLPLLAALTVGALMIVFYESAVRQSAKERAA